MAESILLRIFRVTAKRRGLLAISSQFILRNIMLFLRVTIKQCWKKYKVYWANQISSCAFWTKAINNGVYLVNLSPFSAINFLKMFDLSHKRMTNNSCLRIFYYAAYTFISKQNKTKLDLTFKMCRFLRYAFNVKGYRLWDRVANKVIVNRDVIFDEPRPLREGKSSQAPHTEKEKSTLTDVLKEKLYSRILLRDYVINDLTRGEAPVWVEQVSEQ